MIKEMQEVVDLNQKQKNILSEQRNFNFVNEFKWVIEEYFSPIFNKFHQLKLVSWTQETKTQRTSSSDSPYNITLFENFDSDSVKIELNSEEDGDGFIEEEIEHDIYQVAEQLSKLFTPEVFIYCLGSNTEIMVRRNDMGGVKLCKRSFY
jgi:hypothetical protein